MKDWSSYFHFLALLTYFFQFFCNYCGIYCPLPSVFFSCFYNYFLFCHKRKSIHVIIGSCCRVNQKSVSPKEIWLKGLGFWMVRKRIMYFGDLDQLLHHLTCECCISHYCNHISNSIMTCTIRCINII